MQNRLLRYKVKQPIVLQFPIGGKLFLDDGYIF